MGDPYTLTLTIPDAHWMSANDRQHWAVKAKRTAAVRALAAHHAAGAPSFRQAHVTAWIGYSTRRRADPPNAYPTVKAAIDGITDAGTFPDDSSEYVVALEFRRDPTLAPKGTHTLRLTITDQTLDI